MHYDLPCTLPIGAQGATFTTYRDITCALATNANDAYFYGRIINCTLPITTYLVDAAKGEIQSLRVVCTIDGENVSAALVGNISINHMKNACSTFSLYLNDFSWSPLINSHIRQNKVVIITAFINGYEKKLFTGLVDGTNTEYNNNHFYRINIYGRDYGKKLERKKMSLISVQDEVKERTGWSYVPALNQYSNFRYIAYRGKIIKYMAAQAGITDVECPTGSAVKIDHSFHYQSILDMIVKECNIDTYWWRVDEEGHLIISLSKIKTNVSIYPTAEWEYGEDRFIRLGLKTGPDDYIINKLKVCGAIYDYMLEVENPDDSPAGEYITPASGDEEDQIIDSILYSYSNSWTGGALITGAGVQNNVEMTVTRGSISQVDSLAPFGDGDYYAGPDRYIAAYRYYKIEFKGTNVKTSSINYSTTGYIKVTRSGVGAYSAVLHIKRRLTALTIDGFGTVTAGDEMNGGINIELLGQVVNNQDAADWADVDPPTSAIVDGEEVSTPTYEYSSEQVSAEVTDDASIALYGERMPNNEGTLQFPLAENVDQCEGIAKHIIRESHRFKYQPNFEIPFNPLFTPGQTVGLTDNGIGFNERYHAEAVNHIIGVDSEGKPRARTQLGCVYYAG